MPSFYLMTICWVGLSLWLVSCNASDPSIQPGVLHQENTYAADPIRIPAVPLQHLRIMNDVGGDIVIITGNNEEVAADSIATGTAMTTGAENDIDRAIVEAETHISMTHSLVNGVQEVKVFPLPGMDSHDRAMLHVRVPSGSILDEVQTHGGNISISGGVGGVTANITGGGWIILQGANGPVNLTTDNGSIIADMVPGQDITASAQKGGITIYAVNSAVTAKTSAGDVQFVGTFREKSQNTLSTTGDGNVHVAVTAPSDTIAYTIVATTTIRPIITDYPSDSTSFALCGFIHNNGPYDYHVENAQDRFGRLEVKTLTGTHIFSGTLTTSYYRFDTNQTHVSLFTPHLQGLYLYAEPQLSKIIAGEIPIDQACRAALERKGTDAAVKLNLSSERGRIHFHHIKMLK